MFNCSNCVEIMLNLNPPPLEASFIYSLSTHLKFVCVSFTQCSLLFVSYGFMSDYIKQITYLRHA